VAAMVIDLLVSDTRRHIGLLRHLSRLSRRSWRE